MKDVQNEKDKREIGLDYVGIKNVLVPITVRDKTNKKQNVQADVSVFVNLYKLQKGIHMSHLVDHLFELSNKYGLDQLVKLTNTIKDEQSKENSSVKTKACNTKLKFKYFINKLAPVSKVPSVLGYNVSTDVLVGEEKNYKSIQVKVPVSTCCPCSLELCNNKAAHNQRGIITIKSYQKLNDKTVLWFEDLIQIAEASGSCEIYPVLRRPDEKYVTNKMFKNAKFVEDVVRDVVVKLKKIYPHISFIVSCENMESIHDHSAYAKTFVKGVEK